MRIKHLFIILVLFTISCKNKPRIITAKHSTDTTYYISSHKSANLYITKKIYTELKLANLYNENYNNRLHITYPKYYYITDGDRSTMTEIDYYTFSNIKEGDIKKE
jgi:uncharacterized protein YcfL